MRLGIATSIPWLPGKRHKMGQRQDDVLRSMELFAREVRPRVRALATPAP